MLTITGSSRYKINKKAIQKIVSESLLQEGIDPTQDINLIFVGARKMKQIASTYKGENEALPVLSFTYKQDNLLGEVFICYPEAILLAAERRKEVDDMLLQLIEHGLQNLLK